MMKKILFAAAASAAVFTALPAAAQDWYAQLNAGVALGGQADIDATLTFEDDSQLEGSDEVDLERGLFIGAAAGRSVGPVRVEGEVMLIDNESELKFEDDAGDEINLGTVDVAQTAFFLNAIYDFPMGAATPYVGAGIGYGSTSVEVEDENFHDQGLAWQLKAGVAVPVTEVLTVDVGYRYINGAKFERSAEFADPDFGDIDARVEAEPTSHALTVGARLRFGG